MRLSASLRALPLAAPLALFLAGGVLGLAASYDMSLSIVWLAWLFAGAALYAAVVLLARTPERVLRAAAAPALLSALVGLAVAAQYRHLGFDAKLGLAAQLGAITSAPLPSLGLTDVDANAAAALIEGGLPIAVALALTSRGWRRWAWAAGAAAAALGVFLTVSRGAWMALAVGAALWAAGGWGFAARGQAGGGRARRAVAGAALAALALVAAALLSGALTGVLGSAAARAADRLALYRNSLFLALEFPLSGIGPGGTFPMVYSAFQLLIGVPYLGYAHNLLLGAWLAQGLLGLVGLIALAVRADVLIWRGLAAPDRDGLRALRFGTAVGALALLLHGLTDAPQYDLNRAHLLPVCFLVLGVAVAAARLAHAPAAGSAAAAPRTAQAPAPRRVWLRRGLAAGAAALVLAVAGPALLALGAANVSAVLQARASLGPAAGADMAGARAWAERALAFDPRSAAALKRTGMIALSQGDYGTAVVALERAQRAQPADQSVRKALGLAYVWYGLVDEGAPLLAGLDSPDEVREELWAWSAAWDQRGRPELAQRARQAAERL